jgi:hypothetical protein
MNPIRLVRPVMFVCGVAVGVCASTGTMLAQERIMREKLESLMPQGFSVVLVLGDTQSATTADNVPAAARKALTDMKDFLPYKGYRLLDAQWILGTSRAITRLRGPNGDDQEFQLTLRSNPESGKIRVFFQLQEAGAADTPAADAVELRSRQGQVAALRDRLQTLEAAAARERAKSTGDRQPNADRSTEEAARVKRQIAELDGPVSPGRTRPVIDTSFSMEVGETVVVGTSRVRGGDKALIALLTAVPKGNGAKKK